MAKAPAHLSKDDRLKTAIWRLNVTSTGATEIDLGYSGFGDDEVIEACRYLGRNPILREISFQSNHFGEGGSRAIARALRMNTCLEKIDLRDNNIDDEGCESLVEALRQNRTLRILDLPGNKIGDVGCREMASGLANPNAIGGLWTLRMGSNAFGERAALELIKSLRTNLCLTSLDLSASKLEPKHAEALAEALVAGANRSLEVLTLDDNDLGDSGAKSVARAIAGPGGGGGAGGEARAARNWKRGAVAVKAVKSLAGDKAFREHASGKGGSRWAGAPGRGEGLKEVGLCGNGVTDEGGAALVFAALRHGTERIFLGLNGIRGGGQLLAALGEGQPGCHHLDEVDLSYNAVGTHAASEALAAAAAAAGVRDLKLSGNRGPDLHPGLGFPSGAVKTFRSHAVNGILFPPRPGDAPVDDEPEPEPSEEPEDKSYVAQLRKTCARASALKAARQAELAAQPFSTSRLAAHRLADRELQRATYALRDARRDRAVGKRGPWDGDYNSDEDDDGDLN